jgi:DNA-3-methyladenine glycosylase II
MSPPSESRERAHRRAWTWAVGAPGFLLIALNRPDVFLRGDVALPRAVQRAYRFDHVPTELEMDRLAERCRPYRSLGVAYLFTSEDDEQAQSRAARPATNRAV